MSDLWGDESGAERGKETRVYEHKSTIDVGHSFCVPTSV